MFEVTIEETFSAGHALRNYRGKCENVHGHNYRCRVTVEGGELDEIGLLVLEEIPGWQHIGPEPWKLLAIDNVGRMIRRDWNHPSIILWGVRINESRNDPAFGLTLPKMKPR